MPEQKSLITQTPSRTLTPVSKTESRSAPSVSNHTVLAREAARQRSSEMVMLASNTFSPSLNVKAEIEEAGTDGLDVRVAAKGLTSEGLVCIAASKAGHFSSIQSGSMPIVTSWMQQLGGMCLNIDVKSNIVS